VVITGVGLLVFSSNEGTFDMLVYGVSSFFDLFRKVSKKKYHTFYDYRVSRQDKKIGFGFMLLCGIFFLIIAFVMFFIYRKLS
jgi:large-conductance mechanosensitive channel